MCSHDFSLWETLTSNIEGYKKSCGALRPPSGKEVGTTVFALSGVEVALARGLSFESRGVFKPETFIALLGASRRVSVQKLVSDALFVVCT